MVILTCGLGQIWRNVLARFGSHIVVVGGGRIADGFVITPETKAALVRHIRAAGYEHIWAFGDSPLDLPMLREADEAVVVVGEETTRSRSMEAHWGRRSPAACGRARHGSHPPQSRGWTPRACP